MARRCPKCQGGAAGIPTKIQNERNIDINFFVLTSDENKEKNYLPLNLITFHIVLYSSCIHCQKQSEQSIPQSPTFLTADSIIAETKEGTNSKLGYTE